MCCARILNQQANLPSNSLANIRKQIFNFDIKSKYLCTDIFVVIRNKTLGRPTSCGLRKNMDVLGCEQIQFFLENQLPSVIFNLRQKMWEL